MDRAFGPPGSRRCNRAYVPLEIDGEAVRSEDRQGSEPEAPTLRPSSHESRSPAMRSVHGWSAYSATGSQSSAAQAFHIAAAFSKSRLLPLPFFGEGEEQK